MNPEDAEQEPGPETHHQGADDGRGQALLPHGSQNALGPEGPVPAGDFIPLLDGRRRNRHASQDLILGPVRPAGSAVRLDGELGGSGAAHLVGIASTSTASAMAGATPC